MLLCRTFPQVEDIPANQEYRRFFYSRWGRENCIVSARSRYAEFSPFTQSLSIKAAWGGPERYYVDGRAVGVDDDNYLVLNDQRTYASTLKSRELVHSFSIFFRPGLAEETLGALRQSAESLLAAGGESPAKSVEFAEHLHPHDRLVTPLLRYISSQVDAGLEDEMWYEEQFSYLMERLLRVHHEDLAGSDAARDPPAHRLEHGLHPHLLHAPARHEGPGAGGDALALPLHPPVPRDPRHDAVRLPAAQARRGCGAAPALDGARPGHDREAGRVREPFDDVPAPAAPRRRGRA